MDKRNYNITPLEIVVATTQILTIICIIKENPAWKGCLALLFIGIAVSLFDKFRETKKRPYLYSGICMILIGLTLILWFVIAG